jgi:diguanylate cyclase
MRDQAGSAELRNVIEGVSDALMRLDPPETAAESGKSAKQSGQGFLGRLFGRRTQDTPASPPQEHADDKAPAAQRIATVREILIRLLERLALPDELGEQVEAVRARIEQADEQKAWDAVVEQIADLVQAVRARAHNQNQGVESFLLELSNRLAEVGERLADSERHYEDSFTAGRELDSTVKRGIGDIESGVRQATDLNAIKQLVRSHVDTLLKDMEQHRCAEQERFDRAQADMRVLTERLQQLEGETGSLRTRLREERAQAQTDPLTGIPNRLAYEERLKQEIARWKRFSTPLVLLIWDVDHFKDINDNFGHKAGDKVLRTIARSLADSIRETDFIARYGGEEFAHLMTGSSLADCLKVADKLRAMIESTGFHFRDRAVTVTTSCGIAQFRDGDSAETWFERADRALYQAKKAGRNRCEPES